MRNGSSTLTVEGLSVGDGPIPVLTGLSLDVSKGQALALVGPNGAGKSTLARAISGLHVPETRDIFGDVTVQENLRVAFDNLGGAQARGAAFARIHALFPILQERDGQLAGNLSGGQQQMLAIARALLGRPRESREEMRASGEVVRHYLGITDAA